MMVMNHLEHRFEIKDVLAFDIIFSPYSAHTHTHTHHTHTHTHIYIYIYIYNFVSNLSHYFIYSDTLANEDNSFRDHIR